MSDAALTTGRAERPQLSLLGGFSLRIGGAIVTLPRHARRVLAFLSLDKTAERDCDRGVLAETLWMDAPVQRARGSLRTALWRIRQASPVLVTDVADRIGLGDDIDVDAHRVREEAVHLLSEDDSVDHSRLTAASAVLLPGWDEEWLVLAREQLRQLRLHALEAVGRQLIQRGHYQAAIDVMLGVVAEEPLRESAQIVLIDAHIRDGNMSEARRQLDIFATLLWRELGLRPSPGLRSKLGLAAPLMAASAARDRAAANEVPCRVDGHERATVLRRPMAAEPFRGATAWRR